MTTEWTGFEFKEQNVPLLSPHWKRNLPTSTGPENTCTTPISSDASTKRHKECGLLNTIQIWKNIQTHQNRQKIFVNLKYNLKCDIIFFCILGEVQARGGASTFKTYKPRENIFETIELAKSRHQSIMQKNAFPENLDWRNHKSPNGTTIENFVSSVKDQGGCGSCYSFASMGLLESRVRIATDNAQKPDFAEQEVITCGKDATYSSNWNWTRNRIFF